MALLIFLTQVFLISFSGAMQPGPITATVITTGAKNRYAGTLLAIGHGIIEFPLMLAIIFGMGRYFEIAQVRIAIGLTGGAFLLLMATQMLIGLKANAESHNKALNAKPILAGIILSASNPYFLLWWASVGLALATKASQWGIWAFALFALVHWSVDLIWLQLLSWASFHGSAIFKERTQKIVLLFCALALLAFGIYFIIAAFMTWLT